MTWCLPVQRILLRFAFAVLIWVSFPAECFLPGCLLPYGGDAGHEGQVPKGMPSWARGGVRWRARLIQDLFYATNGKGCGGSCRSCCLAVHRLISQRGCPRHRRRVTGWASSRGRERRAGAGMPGLVAASPANAEWQREWEAMRQKISGLNREVSPGTGAAI